MHSVQFVVRAACLPALVEVQLHNVIQRAVAVPAAEDEHAGVHRGGAMAVPSRRQGATDQRLRPFHAVHTQHEREWVLATGSRIALQLGSDLASRAIRLVVHFPRYTGTSWLFAHGAAADALPTSKYHLHQPTVGATPRVNARSRPKRHLSTTHAGVPLHCPQHTSCSQSAPLGDRPTLKPRQASSLHGPSAHGKCCLHYLGTDSTPWFQCSVASRHASTQGGPCRSNPHCVSHATRKQRAGCVMETTRRWATDPPNTMMRPSGDSSEMWLNRARGGVPPTRGFNQLNASVSYTHRSLNACEPSHPPKYTILEPIVNCEWPNRPVGAAVVDDMRSHVHRSTSKHHRSLYRAPFGPRPPKTYNLSE